MFERFVGENNVVKSTVKTEQNERRKSCGMCGLVLKETAQEPFVTSLCGEKSDGGFSSRWFL